MVMYKEVNGTRLDMSAAEEEEILRQREVDAKARQESMWLRGREEQYPSWKDQLDMLWHEINLKGSISSEGQWFQSIKSIKQKYPKAK